MIAFTRQNPKCLKEERKLPRTAGEQEKVGAEETRMAGDLPREGCLHELFEAEVDAVPNAVALVVGADRITYHELNLRANRVAHHLQSLGVRPEDLVGIFLERSTDMVVAMLGVLKAGGAYVPLDPTYPQERLAFMLEDAQVRTVLSQSSLLAPLQGVKLTAGQALYIVCLDTDPRIALASTENPGPSARSSNLSYVLYTSGSTGRPKGVMLEHHNAVAYVHWAGQVYSARELDGTLAGISISFDLSILDLFVPLSWGGKVILAPGTLALPGLAAASEVRLITTVPSVARELLRIGGIPASVETINLGGEPLSIQLVQQLYALPHIKRVYDLYGPTETTTNSTFALRTPDGPATIGRPIARTQVYLLDGHFQPVPMGARGELFIGGEGVARGYLNRPEITAEKFVHLPLAAGCQTRLYRTGDLCRCRPDGNLEFVGRIDHQVKIRGHRIELGEIETVLLAHPAVSEAIVNAPKEASGERRRLIAYVVLRATPGQEKAETPAATERRIVPQLRSHLQAHLPDYMLPGIFVLLNRFELTPNGKINRFALPAPVQARAAVGDYLAPSTPTEELLCQIWGDLLGLKQIGVHDDFFQLGGDSLQGVAMLMEVERKTGVKLPVDSMLQGPSVGRIAAMLDEGRKSRRSASSFALVEIQPQGSRSRLFLVHGIGGGMLWGYANLARHLGTDQPVYAFKACDPDQSEEFDTIEKMAAQYVQELRHLQPEGPYALGGYCFGGNVAYEMARLLDQQGQRVGLLALMNSSPPNSSYDRVDWTPLYLCKFLRNLGHWAAGFIRWNLAKQWRFVRWKIWNGGKKVAQRLRLSPVRPTGPDVDELVDLSAVSNDQRCLWESHVRALINHQTQPYGGNAILLRTRGHPLKCSYDGQCGWGELVLGGVVVRIIPGLHESLLEEPYVRALARELKIQLDAIQPEAGKSS